MSRRSSAVRSKSLMDPSETELSKLQQQYRSLQRAMWSDTVKAQGLINRGRREIQRLQDEHEQLLLSLGTSLTDASVGQDLTAMLAREDRLNEELEAGKGKVASLKEQILKWERKVEKQRTGGGTTRSSIESDKNKILKATALAENNFRMLMHRNGELREELMTLQAEKTEFLRVQSILKKELHSIRRDVCNLQTECTEANNTSIKVHEEMKMLRDQNAKDVAQFIKEERNLQREISHYCHLEAFLDIKAIERNNQDDRRKAEKCKQPESKELDFEDAIKQILRETGEKDVDTMIRNFRQMEEQNYTLLHFVNYQHNEAQAIQRQISQLCSEREIFLAEQQQQQQQQQALQMRVSIKREAAEQQMAVYQQRVEVMEKLFDQLKEGVKSILHITNDSSVICDQSGPSDQVQYENIIKCLRTVDDRVNELLTLQSCLHLQEKPNPTDIDSVSTKPPSQ